MHQYYHQHRHHLLQLIQVNRPTSIPQKSSKIERVRINEAPPSIVAMNKRTNEQANDQTNGQTKEGE